MKALAMGASTTPPVETPQKRHILLVEDDEAASAAYSRMLRGAGYDVTAAMDFRLALDTLEADQPLDLLLVDIVMPGSVNGLALSRMARMRRQGLKVIYLTGFSIPGAEREALGPILRKPVDEAELLAEVEKALATA
ncbi:MAG TPA: response regulator [Acetobacteraceae bacterium]|nr:response regulator [Acetobacteraceae bacterium]